ncbi:MAG: SDR family NAD(P)-dependent oxidoreductase [Candidatus Nanopelagicales bacterium]|nr:SDR family NAD(P)-dependent oxidoreductase [Candidatus Nanopelagicales bacterium]
MALAVVTGGSRGLGFECARALRRLGHNVVLVAQDHDRLAAAAAALNCDFRSVDLEDIDAAKHCFDEILQSFGVPQILILAHGVMSARDAKTLRTDNSEWRRVMAINLDSVFCAVNTLAAPMAKARDGRVVIFSACLGRMSGPGNAGGLAPYRISKAGVNALVRNLAHETGLGSRGFFVDAVCPGHSRTDMGGPSAPLSVEEGAATAIWLATRTIDPTGITVQEKSTGLLWENMQVVEW